MKNVNMVIENDGKTLTIKVDVTQEFGPSKSGKTIIVASTEGNQTVAVPGHDPVVVGLNIYRKA